MGSYNHLTLNKLQRYLEANNLSSADFDIEETDELKVTRVFTTDEKRLQGPLEFYVSVHFCQFLKKDF